mmetsp:Transcript_5878/g.10280  ORF Transcript_5878/g.10280 Transcript_5878/m.10280 type:complete len:209 (+) Transcript_5878:164-790(+)
MSSIPFERYDDEFQSLTDQVKDSLKDTSNIEFSASLLMQCEDLLKQMSVEARGVEDASMKRELLAKVRSCKSDLQTLREQHKQAQQTQQRNELMIGTVGGGKGDRSEAKERLLSAQSQLEQQNDTLDKARRVMADTEEVALEITTELGRNRETLETAHGRVREMSGLTNRARRLLQNMNRRAVQQKLAMYGMAGVIVIVVVIILWNIT